MSDILGIDQDAVFGKLIRFWIWADQQSTDGTLLKRFCNAPGVTEKFIDRITCCPGFSAAMRKVGWISGEDEISLPNFDRHNGQTAKARGLTYNRVKRNRNAPSVTKSLPETETETEVLKPPLPPKGETPKTAGISKADLADVGKIQRWLSRRGKKLGLKNDHAVLTMLVAASERAIEVGDDPVGLFIALARDGGKGDWSKISGEQHDRAKVRMRNHIPPGAALAETNGVPGDE